MVFVFYAANAQYGEGVFFAFLWHIVRFLALMIICLMLKRLQAGARTIADGDLEHRIDTKNLYLDFKEHAECLNRIMKTRGLSAADLAALLNLKSKTTVVRILQNNAGEKAILNFRNLLANSSELALTAEELQKLDDSVSCQRKETDQNLLFGELW